MRQLLKAGFGKADITAPVGTPMAGHPAGKHSTGVLDPLFARCMMVKSGSVRVLFVSCDVVLIGDKLARSLKEGIRRLTSIPPENVIISATHTHSGPLFEDLFGQSGGQEPVGIIYRGVMAAVRTARKNLAPARIGFASAEVPGLAFNRRYYMKNGGVETHPMKGDSGILKSEGPVDPEAGMIYFFGESGDFLGGMVNFSCHATCLERENTLFSADYPGFIERAFCRRKKPEPVILFLMGASGNICQVNPLDKARREVGAAWAKHLGYAIAAALRKKVNRKNTRNTLEIQILTAVCPAPLRRLTPKEAATAAERAVGHRGRNELAPKLSDYGVEGYGWSGGFSLRELLRTNFWKKMEAGEQMSFLKKNRKTDYYDVEISMVSFGVHALVAVPCELFVEFGLKIKKEAKARQVFVATLSNGYVSYVPTERAFKNKGGYETIPLLSSKLAPQAGRIIVESALKLIN